MVISTPHLANQIDRCMVAYPVDVKVHDRELHVAWSDGHRSIYAHKFLRENCPCAACRGEPGVFGKAYAPLPQQVPDDVKPTGFGQVGRYGVSIAWSDGHSTGVYSFDHLRALCQCDKCREDG